MIDRYKGFLSRIKSNIPFIGLIILSTIMLLVSSCGEGVNVGEANKVFKSLTICWQEGVNTGECGSKYPVKVKVRALDQNGDIYKWSGIVNILLTNPNITLSPNQVELVNGEADVELTFTHYTEDVEVTNIKLGGGDITTTLNYPVKVYPNVKSISVNEDDILLLKGNKVSLSYTIIPDNAWNKNIIWESSDLSIAEVDSNGSVNSVDIGEVIITVTTIDGNNQDTCEVYVYKNVPFNMVNVPAKSFYIGIDDSGTASVNNPFLIGETEVTYELWWNVYVWAIHNSYNFENSGQQGGNENYYGPSGTNQNPVTMVNWRDCIVWCNALTEYYNSQNGTSYSCVYKDNGVPIRDSSASNAEQCDNVVPDDNADGFRLLTSNEWELAARYIGDYNGDGDIMDEGEYYPGNYLSGATTYYNDTNDINPANGVPDGKDTNDAVAVYGEYWDGSNWVPTGINSTADVKTKNPNALGIYDMSGNVWEWCFTSCETNRIEKGGSWFNGSEPIGSWACDDPSTADNKIEGFRIARTP